ncbi:MAG: NAD-dependent dehydratase [Nitrosomonadaceae bacterium]|nr:NAD-dependent dehydratase [Nitrosomonadaceae bacterium]|tara:strand:+ start:4225 stop:5166 length:942 start_codon:yes stop_codon:yes gene_type:complete
MRIKNVCIIGGSGFVGQHIAHLLYAQGIKVRILTRRRENAKSLFVLPTIEVVETNIHDPRELSQSLVGIDAVINLVGILDGDFVLTHVELPRKIVAACVQNDVSRILHVSALHASTDGTSAYLRSKGEGEKIIIESNLEMTIFRPSVIFGPGDSFLNLFANLIKRLPVLPLGSPNAKFQPVFIGDIAEVIIASLSISATFGQSYDLCGPKIYSLRQIVEYVSNITKHKLSIIGLNDWLSYLQAACLEILPGKLMTRDNYLSMKTDSICHCKNENNLMKKFGIQPTELEEVAPQYLAPNTPRDRYIGFRDRAGR